MLKSSDNTKDITDALKGIAILVVMLGHYAQYMASDYYSSWFRGYAFGVVAIFFVLAGYGAYFSLGKRIGRQVLKKALPGYYLDRAIRIYPMYWLALLLTAGYFPEYDLVYQLDPYTVAVFLGLPFVNAPGIFWFVPAIILCYILAPFIYALLVKVRLGQFLIIMLASVPVSLAVTFLYLSSVDPDVSIFTWSNLNIFFYKDYFFSNVLLFSLGMAISPIATRYQNETLSKTLIIPSASLFVLMLYLTRASFSFYDQGYDLSLILLAPLFVASCFSLCLVTIASNMSVSGARVFSFAGEYSYPLYLFHMLYIALLARLNMVEDNDLWSFLIFICLIPLLVLLFRGIDYGLSSNKDSEND